jgi:hypothetical protein
MQRQQVGGESATSVAAYPIGEHVDSRVSEHTQRSESSPSQLAPGQKWNPAEKIKMVPPRRTTQSPGVVYVLNAQQKAEPRRVVLGITDGSLTEIVSGDLMPGDPVIIGDNLQGGGTASASGFSSFGGFGARGGGAGARGR